MSKKKEEDNHTLDTWQDTRFRAINAGTSEEVAQFNWWRENMQKQVARAFLVPAHMLGPHPKNIMFHPRQQGKSMAHRIRMAWLRGEEFPDD